MKRVVLGLVVCVVSAWAIKVGEVPPPVTISGDAGGKVSGGAWHSDEMKGKVAILFYVDPDEKDLNEPFAQRLSKKSTMTARRSSLPQWSTWLRHGSPT